MSKSKKSGLYSFLNLLSTGLELEECISNYIVTKILYLSPDGTLYIDSNKNEKKNGKTFYNIDIIYTECLDKVKFFDKQNNEIWKIIKYPTVYSAAKFTNYYNKIVEEYLSHSTSANVNFKYLRL